MAMTYKVKLNHGCEAFNSGDSVTVEEVTRVVDEQYLAEEINHINSLIPVQVARSVLDNFCEAAARLMSQGYAINLCHDGKAAIKLYGDIHVSGGNINLKRAKTLIPGTTALTKKNAGELVTKAGVTFRAKCEAEDELTKLLKSQGASLQREAEVTEIAKVKKKGSTSGGSTYTPDEDGLGS